MNVIDGFISSNLPVRWTGNYIDDVGIVGDKITNSSFKAAPDAPVESVLDLWSLVRAVKSLLIHLVIGLPVRIGTHVAF